MRSRRFLRAVGMVVKSPRIVFLVALTARLWVLAQLLHTKAWPDFYGENEFARMAWQRRTTSAVQLDFRNPSAISSRVSRKLRRRLVRLEQPHLTILVIQQ